MRWSRNSAIGWELQLWDQRLNSQRCWNRPNEYPTNSVLLQASCGSRSLPKSFAESRYCLHSKTKRVLPNELRKYPKLFLPHPWPPWNRLTRRSADMNSGTVLFLLCGDTLIFRTFQIVLDLAFRRPLLQHLGHSRLSYLQYPGEEIHLHRSFSGKVGNVRISLWVASRAHASDIKLGSWIPASSVRLMALLVTSQVRLILITVTFSNYPYRDENWFRTTRRVWYYNPLIFPSFKNSLRTNEF